MKHKFFFLFLLFAGLTLSASADTLQLTGTGGASSDGVYVYPYYFTTNVGGVTAKNVPLICIDFNREITFGETWHVTESAIPTSGTDSMSVDLRALALIDFGASTGYGGVSATDYQFAAWDILDPSGVAGKAGLTPLAQYVASVALGAAAGGSTLPSNFSYANYMLYTPTADTTGWTDGIPQRFIGAVPAGFTPNSLPPVAPTPEPSGLLLVGTGILGAAGLMYRRVRTAILVG